MTSATTPTGPTRLLTTRDGGLLAGAVLLALVVPLVQHRAGDAA